MWERYVDLGWKLLPLLLADRRPPFGWGTFYDNPPSVEQMRRWSLLFPLDEKYGLAVLTGRPSNVVVIDVDDPCAAEQFLRTIPSSPPRVKTLRGWHFYFSTNHEIPTMALAIPGIVTVEIKGERSLVPLPPSLHPKNPRQFYSWEIEPWEVLEIPQLPEFIIESIANQEREKTLAQAVRSIPFAGGRKETLDISRIAAAVGVEIKKAVASGNKEIWRLDRCPICGKDEGNPWLAPETGRLFDFRATCPASVNTGGMALRDWLHRIGRADLLDEVRDGEVLLDQSIIPAAPVCVSDARAKILQVLRSDQDALITVPPGVGKSVTALKWLAREGPRPAIYSVPTLKLAEEFASRMRQITKDPVVVLVGRNAQTCLRWQEAQVAHDLGYNPGEVLCATCPHNPDTAFAAEPCRFMRQFKEIRNKNNNLFFTSHILAAHLAGDWLKGAQIWIADEQIHAFAESVRCPADALKTLRAIFPPDSGTMCLAEAILKLGDDLHRMVAGGKRQFAEGRIFARPPGFGPWQKSKSLAEIVGFDITLHGPAIRQEIANTLKIHTKKGLFGRGVNFKALAWLYEIASSGSAYLVARRDMNYPIELCRSVNTFPQSWKGKIAVLDATAYPPLIEKITGRRLRVVNVSVPIDARKVWIKRSVSKTGIVRERGAAVALKALGVALNTVTGKTILVVCHKSIKKQVISVTAHDRRVVDVIHHFGTSSRGTNDFADCDVVILLGLPIPNPGHFFDVALAAGLTEGEWNAFMETIAAAEAVQELHRIRPVLHRGKEIAIIAPRWPLDTWIGEPDEVVEPTEIRGKLDLAADILIVWLQAFGFVFIEIALVLGIGRQEQIYPEEVQKAFFEQVSKAFPDTFNTFMSGYLNLLRAGKPLKTCGTVFQTIFKYNMV